MYFKFPDNLPASVVRATFDFYAAGEPGGTHLLLPASVADQSTFVDVPREVTHLHAIRFQTPGDAFTYYYPAKGYPLAEGGFLPTLIPPTPGEPYAGGIVIQTGRSYPHRQANPEIQPFQGILIALAEQTNSYPEGESYCRQLTLQTGTPWELPDLHTLMDFHDRQATIDRFLLRHGGIPLAPADYWCQDNSVVELGISFHLLSARYAIDKKTEQKQIRPIARY